MGAMLVTVLALWATMVVAPETRVARNLRRWVVDAPAARLNRITPGQIVLAMALAIMAGLVMWIGGGDGARALGMAVPDLATSLASLEVTAYLDIAVAAVAAWSVLRVRGVRDHAGMVLSRLHGRLRLIGPRARKTRAAIRPEPSNDDDEPGFLFLAA